MSSSYKPSEDVRGAGKLTKDAVIGIVDLVESVHAAILKFGKIQAKTDSARTNGITGFVYNSVRKVTEMLGSGSDLLLQQLAKKVASQPSSLQREAIISILNGVLGDYLQKNQNPLAISMSLRRNGIPIHLENLRKEIEISGGRLMIFIHGLCMNDIQWGRKGYNYAETLSEKYATPYVHLHYNTGKHISENGEELSLLLENLVEHIPSLHKVDVVTHSMGGLVTRSALHFASENSQQWPKKIAKVIFLGTPHNGALLERAGNWFEMLLDNTPYTAPFNRLSRIRSNGITDLRYAYLIHDDWDGKDAHSEKGHPGKFIPLHEHIEFYAIAAITSPKETFIGHHIIGDGLVTKTSAFGEKDKTHQDLHIPEHHKYLVTGLPHLDLMCNQSVLEQISQIIQEA